MTSERSPKSEPESRVVRFRPRGPVLRSGSPEPPPPVADLRQFERSRGDDDFRHRMVTNGIALLVTALLVIAGIWLADRIAEMRKDQDCVLTGRRNCSPVDAPPRLL